MADAAARWKRDLQGWGIEEPILAQAPESPWGFPAWLFDRAPEPLETPSRRRALEVLPEGGTVLDVGSGGGRASLGLVPPASRVVAVDESEELLDAFARRAGEVGVEHAEIKGTWPHVAAAAPVADVVVCHHVFYNVPELPRFVRALDDKARVRVVAELSDRHPLAALDRLWRHFWGVARPPGPTAHDALAVLAETGIRATIEISERPSIWRELPFERAVEFARVRLCLPRERDPEIAEMIDPDDLLAPRVVATIWWDAAL